ncbi:hypothetical protein ILUMI_04529 [Ignelater luminosus]|uniref:Insertion element IS150 protein InsJ-like helix-turn-helix domain-containing protein n=1 Tax=Ignelater luminosus TaxID=2038154 RepID=A0A8K0DEK9_IGNLU|nr:hypothetical protein ILUMI_04529 [Ignelater luminosus]
MLKAWKFQFNNNLLSKIGKWESSGLKELNSNMSNIYSLPKSHNNLDCAKAVALVEDGRDQRYVARVFNVSYFTIQRVLARFQETGRNIRRPGCDRKRKTTANNDGFLVLNTLRDSHLTSVETKNQLREVRGIEVGVAKLTGG